MKRFLLVLAVAALMAMMLVVMAAPAMAKGSGGVVKIDPGTNTLTTSPKSFQQEPKVKSFLPSDPIYPVDPVSPLNPNVVGGCTLDDLTLCG